MISGGYKTSYQQVRMLAHSTVVFNGWLYPARSPIKRKQFLYVNINLTYLETSCRIRKKEINKKKLIEF